jgi:hypothetical protein
MKYFQYQVVNWMKQPSQIPNIPFAKILLHRQADGARMGFCAIAPSGR